MSSKSAAAEAKPKTKQFGKGERQIPHHSEKAKRFYPAQDEKKPKKVRLAYLVITVAIIVYGELYNESQMREVNEELYLGHQSGEVIWQS